MTSAITESAVREALSRVEDPEIGRPITELDMVKSVNVDGNDVAVEIYLTIAGCPMKNTIEANTRAVLEDLEGVGKVSVALDAMSDEQRRALKQK
ncbi:metal-sulfur cluster assembly factor, partial [Corynebacterium striatum]